MELGDSGSTGHKKHHHTGEHIHFKEEEVKGHEEGHIIHEASTHFVVSLHNFQKPVEQEEEDGAEQELNQHLKEAEVNTKENTHHHEQGQ